MGMGMGVVREAGAEDRGQREGAGGGRLTDEALGSQTRRLELAAAVRRDLLAVGLVAAVGEPDPAGDRPVQGDQTPRVCRHEVGVARGLDRRRLREVPVRLPGGRRKGRRGRRLRNGRRGGGGWAPGLPGGLVEAAVGELAPAHGELRAGRGVGDVLGGADLHGRHRAANHQQLARGWARDLAVGEGGAPGRGAQGEVAAARLLEELDVDNVAPAMQGRSPAAPDPQRQCLQQGVRSGGADSAGRLATHLPARLQVESGLPRASGRADRRSAAMPGARLQASRCAGAGNTYNALGPLL